MVSPSDERITISNTLSLTNFIPVDEIIFCTNRFTSDKSRVLFTSTEFRRKTKIAMHSLVAQMNLILSVLMLVSEHNLFRSSICSSSSFTSWNISFRAVVCSPVSKIDIRCLKFGSHKKH